MSPIRTIPSGQTSDDPLYVSAADTAVIDAFGRQRVSPPETLFDSKQLHDAAPLFWDDQQVSGSGTSSSHSTDEAMVTMGVGATTAGNRTRQTFMRFNYQPGKSQLIFMTMVLDDSGGGTGITRSVGQFDDDNGIFLKDDEGTLKLVVRSSTSGSPVDTEVAQTAWNRDKFDGSGVSGVTLDVTKTQILVIDYEWLGVGRVRAGFVIDGLIYYAHEFLHANVASLVYMSTPNLPLRYEIANDGTGAASTLGHICSTVISEGGQQDTGTLRWGSTSGTAVTTNAENTIFAVYGIRLKSTHLDAAVKIVRSALQVQSASEYLEWMLIFNPTVAGTFTYSDVANSCIQDATGATANTVTGGQPVAGGFMSVGTAQQGGSENLAEITNARLLGSAIDGTPDELVLCVRPIGGVSALDVEGGIAWRELS